MSNRNWPPHTVVCLSLNLFLCFLLVISCQKPENHPNKTPKKRELTPAPSQSHTQQSNPEVDLNKAHALLDRYEKELPRIEAAQRPQILAELARLCFILGEWGKKADEKKYFGKGQDFAQRLIREQPQRVEGHYWLALNLSGLADLNGDLSLVPGIVKQMKIAAKLDGNYNQAGPHRVLGRIYFKAPPWPLSVGDIQKSLIHLRQAVKLAPTNSTNHLFLAETLLDLGKIGPACRQLQETFTATHHGYYKVNGLT